MKNGRKVGIVVFLFALRYGHAAKQMQSREAIDITGMIEAKS